MGAPTAAAGPTGEHNFPSTSNGIDSPLSQTVRSLSLTLPDSVKQKIWQHKFVDLNNFLPKNNPSKRIKLEVDNSGNYIFSSPPTELHAPLSIEKWTSAFIVFSATYLEHFASFYPHKALELFYYLDTIRFAASTFRGRGWALYDENTRQTLDLPASPIP